MIRSAIIGVLALVVGAALGGLWGRHALAPGLNDALDDAQALRAVNASLLEEVDDYAPRLERLNRENEALDDHVNALLAALEELEEAEGRDRDGLELGGAGEEDVWVEEPSPEGAGREFSFREFMEANPQAAEAMTRRREEAMERRREGAMERREWFDAFMEEQAANAPDASTSERILAIAEQQRYVQDLGREMAAAESEEERAEIGAAMREGWENLQILMREQQNDMFRNVAEAHGIKDPEEQDALAREVREMMRSPLFTMQRGFGPGEFRGGFRGGNRGRRPRQDSAPQ